MPILEQGYVHANTKKSQKAASAISKQTSFSLNKEYRPTQPSSSSYQIKMFEGIVPMREEAPVFGLALHASDMEVCVRSTTCRSVVKNTNTSFLDIKLLHVTKS